MNRFAVIASLFFACSPVKGTPLIDAEVINVDTLQVTPATTSERVGLDPPTKLSVMGTFSDGTTKDVTPYVTWTSSDTSVVTTDATGLVTAVGPGTTTVSAALDGMKGSAMFTTVEPTIAISSPSSEGVDFFTATQSGNATPLRSIRGAATGLSSGVWHLATDNKELFVSEDETGIWVFPLDGGGGSGSAANIAPLRHIAGSNSATGTYGMQILNNEMYVSTSNPANELMVFPEDGSGDPVPTRSISGSNTMLQTPYGIALYNGEIYVANSGGQILVFPEMGSGNIAPTRVISGSATELSVPVDVTIINGEMYVSNFGNQSTLVFPSDGSGDIAPTRWIHGPNTSFAGPTACVAIGDTLISVQDQVSTGSNAALTFPLEATGDTPPTIMLGGSATFIDIPIGITAF
jgi:hypothetical protein